MSDLDYPIHPRTGLAAVGFRRNGQPIWPIMGASDDPPADNGSGEENPPADDKADPPPGEPKTYASQAEVNAAIEARIARERQKFKDYDDLKAKASKLDELEAANASELDKAVKAARDEARAEVVREFGQKLAAGIIKAELSQRMKPADADALIGDLNLAKYVGEDGEVDSDAIKSLIDRVAPKVQTDLGQGARGGQAKPKNLNEAISNHYGSARS